MFTTGETGYLLLAVVCVECSDLHFLASAWLCRLIIPERHSVMCILFVSWIPGIFIHHPFWGCVHCQWHGHSNTVHQPGAIKNLAASVASQQVSHEIHCDYATYISVCDLHAWWRRVSFEALFNIGCGNNLCSSDGLPHGHGIHSLNLAYICCFKCLRSFSARKSVGWTWTWIPLYRSRNNYHQVCLRVSSDGRISNEHIGWLRHSQDI